MLRSAMSIDDSCVVASASPHFRRRSLALIQFPRTTYALYPESSAIEMKPSAEKKKPGSFGPAARAHIRNFLECIRTRKDPNAPVEAGQATNIVLCMAMDSLRAGRRLKWNSRTRQVES